MKMEQRGPFVYCIPKWQKASDAMILKENTRTLKVHVKKKGSDSNTRRRTDRLF